MELQRAELERRRTALSEAAEQASALQQQLDEAERGNAEMRVARRGVDSELELSREELVQLRAELRSTSDELERARKELRGKKKSVDEATAAAIALRRAEPSRASAEPSRTSAELLVQLRLSCRWRGIRNAVASLNAVAWCGALSGGRSCRFPSRQVRCRRRSPRRLRSCASCRRAWPAALLASPLRPENCRAHGHWCRDRCAALGKGRRTAAQCGLGSPVQAEFDAKRIALDDLRRAKLAASKEHARVRDELAAKLAEGEDELKRERAASSAARAQAEAERTERLGCARWRRHGRVVLATRGTIALAMLSFAHNGSRSGVSGTCIGSVRLSP